MAKQLLNLALIAIAIGLVVGAVFGWRSPFSSVSQNAPTEEPEASPVIEPTSLPTLEPAAPVPATGYQQPLNDSFEQPQPTDNDAPIQALW